MVERPCKLKMLRGRTKMRFPTEMKVTGLVDAPALRTVVLSVGSGTPYTTAKVEASNSLTTRRVIRRGKTGHIVSSTEAPPAMSTLRINQMWRLSYEMSNIILLSPPQAKKSTFQLGSMTTLELHLQQPHSTGDPMDKTSSPELQCWTMEKRTMEKPTIKCSEQFFPLSQTVPLSNSMLPRVTAIIRVLGLPPQMIMGPKQQIAS